LQECDRIIAMSSKSKSKKGFILGITKAFQGSRSRSLSNLREKLAANRETRNRNKAVAEAAATRNRNNAAAKARARKVAQEWLSRSDAPPLKSRPPRNPFRESIKARNLKTQTLTQNPRGVANMYMYTHDQFYALSPEDRQRFKAVLMKSGYTKRNVNDNYPERNVIDNYPERENFAVYPDDRRLYRRY